jgi:hypothetical protein
MPLVFRAAVLDVAKQSMQSPRDAYGDPDRALVQTPFVALVSSSD